MHLVYFYWDFTTTQCLCGVRSDWYAVLCSRSSDALAYLNDCKQRFIEEDGASWFYIDTIQLGMQALCIAAEILVS